VRSERRLIVTTASGKQIDVLHPAKELIDPKDIAHGLARIQRFHGQTYLPCSVARHSLVVASIVPDEYKLEALLHDAHEAYVGDVVMPVKALVGCEKIHEIERPIRVAIEKRFPIHGRLGDVVEQADRAACMAELTLFFPEHVAQKPVPFSDVKPELFGAALRAWVRALAVPALDRTPLDEADFLDALLRLTNECNHIPTRGV